MHYDKLEHAWQKTWKEILDLLKENDIQEKRERSNCSLETLRKISQLRKRTRRYRQVLRK